MWLLDFLALTFGKHRQWTVFLADSRESEVWYLLSGFLCVTHLYLKRAIVAMSYNLPSTIDEMAGLTGNYKM